MDTEFFDQVLDDHGGAYFSRSAAELVLCVVMKAHKT